MVYYPQAKLGLSWVQLKGKCDSKGATLFHNLEQLRDQYDLKSAVVEDEILNEAKKSCPMTDEKWNELINQKCVPNENLISISQNAIDSIQLCFDTKDELSKEERVKAKQELLENFCWMIKTWYDFININ